MRGRYYGEEERGGCDGGWDVGEGEDAVFEDGVEDAELDSNQYMSLWLLKTRFR